MECPYLETNKKGVICNAAISFITPDSEQAETYCATEEHYLCPSLLGHVLRGARKAFRTAPAEGKAQ